MKKNLLAITACFMACLLLAGCGAARNETGSSQPSETLTGADSMYTGDRFAALYVRYDSHRSFLSETGHA